jgi:hypothetical protein
LCAAEKIRHRVRRKAPVGTHIGRFADSQIKIGRFADWEIGGWRRVAIPNLLIVEFSDLLTF